MKLSNDRLWDQTAVSAMMVNQSDEKVTYPVEVPRHFVSNLTKMVGPKTADLALNHLMNVAINTMVSEAFENLGGIEGVNAAAAELSK